MIPCEKLVYLPFQPTSDGLVCDGVSVHAIAAQAGTPLYIYSAEAIRRAYHSIDAAFA
jgi:diaminopimelate decarboxylase